MSSEAPARAPLVDMQGPETAGLNNRPFGEFADGVARRLRSSERLIRIGEVIPRIGVHRGTIYKWLNGGRFPNQVSLGANSCAWYESDIDA